nr:reverse transcriptase domain-containing protein [Tanacetum cinerariifolium]
EEDFDALLDEGSEILHSIEGTILEEKLFVEFDEFIEMNADENFKSESDTEEPPFEKITFNIDYKIKTSLEEPSMDLELNLFLITWNMYSWKNPLFFLLSYHLSFLKKIKISLYMFLKDTSKPLLGKQQTFLESVHLFVNIKCNLEGWRVCIDYQKLNEATAKEHFPLPFMDQRLERLARNKYSCLLDGFSGYFQIPIDPMDQEKTTFTCPFESVKVFMDDFSVFGSSFDHCLNNLDKMLQHFKDAHLVLNCEKCQFMVKEGIVLRHKVSEAGLGVKKQKST